MQLEDSLFRFAEESYAWNFWAAVSLHPNEAYTVKAQSPDGEITSATARIPPDFPPPRYTIPKEPTNVSLKLIQ